ncbi:MAG: ABC transporter ATP-binding protein [Candidatus Thermoplasmatota archaeon]|nr:ABC transporter ATP-binding protein [Candidatus Thermoplasmatota archaeon]
MPLVELRRVTKRFGPIVAVEDVDLRVDDGEYVTVLGPSGCGKTTLIKMIAGIWAPTEGEVLVDGRDVVPVLLEDRDLGYVFQNIVLFPHLSVWKNATYSPWVRGLGEEEVSSIGKEVLRLVDLLDQSRFFPRELSGGAQQKAALARALANRAQLLILDEPLSALDSRVRLELRYQLRALVKDLGLTAIHVTHDQEEALSVADRVVVMRKGRIVEEGSPRELYRSPAHIFTSNFVGENNFLEGSIAKRADEWALVALRNQQYLWVPDGRHSVGRAVVLAWRPEYLDLRKGYSPNGLPGTVEGERFLGSELRYIVRLATEERVSVDVPLTHERFKVGEDTTVEFDYEKMLIYPRPYEGLEEALKLE